MRASVSVSAGFVPGAGVSGCDTGKQSSTPAGGVESRGNRENTPGVHRFEAADVSGDVRVRAEAQGCSDNGDLHPRYE